jgi:hypothetical protein
LFYAISNATLESKFSEVLLRLAEDWDEEVEEAGWSESV